MCAEDGTGRHLDDINLFIADCEQTIDAAVKAEQYGLAIQCEHQLEHWHYRKSMITGKNEYQVSAFLTRTRPSH